MSIRYHHTNIIYCIMNTPYKNSLQHDCLHSCWRSWCHVGKTTGEGNALDETEWEHGLGSHDQIISCAWRTWGYACRRFNIGSFTSTTIITTSNSATPYFVFLTSNISPIRQIGRMCRFNDHSFCRVWVTYSTTNQQYRLVFFKEAFQGWWSYTAWQYIAKGLKGMLQGKICCWASILYLWSLQMAGYHVWDFPQIVRHSAWRTCIINFGLKKIVTQRRLGHSASLSINHHQLLGIFGRVAVLRYSPCLDYGAWRSQNYIQHSWGIV